MARSITAVEAGGRTRVVLNLVKLVPYEIQTSRSNQVVVTLQGAGATGSAAFAAGEAAGRGSADGGTIENVDFRRGEGGRGAPDRGPSRIPSIVVDTRQEGDDIIVEFLNADAAGREASSGGSTCVDFATPVRIVDTKPGRAQRAHDRWTPDGRLRAPRLPVPTTCSRST